MVGYSGDQYGSRFIQKKLETSDGDARTPDPFKVAAVEDFLTTPTRNYGTKNCYLRAHERNAREDINGRILPPKPPRASSITSRTSPPYRSSFTSDYKVDELAEYSSLISFSSSLAKANEAKPRLGKDKVDILEREFEKNPKPTTQTKREFADDMGVELSKINVSLWYINKLTLTNEV